MGSRTACSRPVLFKAKASDHDCWKNKIMTFLIKIQLLNWQQNVYQSTKYYELSTLITHRWLEADASRGRPELLEAKATILGQSSRTPCLLCSVLAVSLVGSSLLNVLILHKERVFAWCWNCLQSSPVYCCSSHKAATFLILVCTTVINNKHTLRHKVSDEKLSYRQQTTGQPST